jgi:hypothetical protein
MARVELQRELDWDLLEHDDHRKLQALVRELNRIYGWRRNHRRATDSNGRSR